MPSHAPPARGEAINMGEMVQNLSSELAGIVESAGRWAVRVEGRRRMPATGIAWTHSGVIATASHVVERDEELWSGAGAARLPGRGAAAGSPPQGRRRAAGPGKRAADSLGRI